MAKKVTPLSADEIRLAAEEKYIHFTEHHALRDMLPQAWDAAFAVSDPAYDKHGLLVMQVPSRSLPVHRTVTLATAAGETFTLKARKNTGVEVVQKLKGEITSESLNVTHPETGSHVVAVLEAWARAACPSPQIPELNVRIREMKDYMREGIEERRELAARQTQDILQDPRSILLFR